MKLKDYMIISILALIFLITFILIQVTQKKAGDLALVYVAGVKVIEVDFSKNNYELFEQENHEEYPKSSINEDSNVEVIILGEYQLNGKRTEVVIEISFEKQAIRIKKDSTPKQIGVNRNWYDGKGLPVVSLPNLVYIKFEKEITDGVDAEIWKT